MIISLTFVTKSSRICENRTDSEMSSMSTTTNCSSMRPMTSLSQLGRETVLVFRSSSVSTGSGNAKRFGVEVVISSDVLPPCSRTLRTASSTRESTITSSLTMPRR